MKAAAVAAGPARFVVAVADQVPAASDFAVRAIAADSHLAASVVVARDPAAVSDSVVAGRAVVADSHLAAVSGA